MSIVTTKALGYIKDNGKNFDEKNKKTIKFLVDVKVVYIFTYIYVSVVNLISTTARTEALDDQDCNRTYNLSPLPEHTDVQVRLIGNAVLWSCRDQSSTQYYYQFLYKMLIIVLAVALIGFLVAKFIALMTVLCNTKYALNKLWQLAIISELIKKVKRDNKHTAAAKIDQQVVYVNTDQNTHCTDDQHDNGEGQRRVTIVEVNITDVTSDVNHVNTDMQTTNDQDNPGEKDMVADGYREDVIGEQQTDKTSFKAAADGKLSNNCDAKNEEFFKHLFFQYLPDEIYLKIKECKWRSRLVMTIPIVLLFFLVAAMAISLLSYDLHPLGCIIGPEQNEIKYKAKKQEVDFDFPDSLQNFQIAAGFSVVLLGFMYLLLALVFWRSSEIISYKLLQNKAKEHVEEEFAKFRYSNEL